MVKTIVSSVSSSAEVCLPLRTLAEMLTSL